MNSVITKTLDDTYNIMKSLDNNERIQTDCRFFSMFMRCLKKDPDIPNILDYLALQVSYR